MWSNQKQQKSCFPLYLTYKPTIILNWISKKMWTNIRRQVVNQRHQTSQGQSRKTCLELSLHKMSGLGRWWGNILLNLFNSINIVRSIIYPDYIKIDIFCISLPLVVYICDGCKIAFECYYLMHLPGQSIFNSLRPSDAYMRLRH